MPQGKTDFEFLLQHRFVQKVSAIFLLETFEKAEVAGTFPAPQFEKRILGTVNQGQALIVDIVDAGWRKESGYFQVHIVKIRFFGGNQYFCKMKLRLSILLILLLPFGLYAQTGGMDAAIDRYESITVQCIRMKQSVAAGEKVSRSELSALIKDLNGLRAELRGLRQG